jgi:hypothetical protein
LPVVFAVAVAATLLPGIEVVAAVAAKLLIWPNAVAPLMNALGMDAGEFVFVGKSE